MSRKLEVKGLFGSVKFGSVRKPGFDKVKKRIDQNHNSIIEKMISDHLHIENFIIYILRMDIYDMACPVWHYHPPIPIAGRSHNNIFLG